jgi:plastocyanin
MTLRLTAVLAAVVLVAAACGGAGTPGTSGQPSPPVGSPGSHQAAGSCPAAAGLSSGANDHGARAASGVGSGIEASDTFFAPTCLTGLHPGGFALTVHNGGTALHNISVTDLSIDVDVEPGQTVTVQVRIGTAVVPFFCKYHRASGMVGSLVAAGFSG